MLAPGNGVQKFVLRAIRLQYAVEDEGKCDGTRLAGLIPCTGAFREGSVGEDLEDGPMARSHGIGVAVGFRSHGCPARESYPPNGSRLSCGRNARRRKAAEPQTKRLAGEAT